MQIRLSIVPVVYVRTLPARSNSTVPAGRSRGLWIEILKTYEHDVGLHTHELTHVKQFWKNFPLFTKRYKDPEFRLASEAEAYAAQLFKEPLHLRAIRQNQYIGFMVANYNLPQSRATIAAAFQAAIAKEENRNRTR